MREGVVKYAPREELKLRDSVPLPFCPTCSRARRVVDGKCIVCDTTIEEKA
jgi:molybdenum cofactor biosynthesis enzyme MoaA